MASSQIPVSNQKNFFLILLTFSDCDVYVFAKAGLTNKMMQISKASHWFQQRNKISLIFGMYHLIINN